MGIGNRYTPIACRAKLQSYEEWRKYRAHEGSTLIFVLVAGIEVAVKISVGITVKVPVSIPVEIAIVVSVKRTAVVAIAAIKWASVAIIGAWSAISAATTATAAVESSTAASAAIESSTTAAGSWFVRSNTFVHNDVPSMKFTSVQRFHCNDRFFGVGHFYKCKSF